MGRTLDRRRLGIFRGALGFEAAGSICFSGLDTSDKVLLGVDTGLAEASVSNAGTWGEASQEEFHPSKWP